MSQQPQSGKRIVSKGEYVQRQGTKVTVGSMAACLWLVALGSWLLTTLLFVGLMFCLVNVMKWGLLVVVGCLGCLCFVGYGTCLMAKLAHEVTKTARNIQPGIPLTRANTGDLPAPESLVRASVEPMQEQEALLRAVTEGQEKHEEQLLRASIGGQE